jgi:hypothetical protein
VRLKLSLASAARAADAGVCSGVFLGNNMKPTKVIEISELFDGLFRVVISLGLLPICDRSQSDGAL